jgi:hypothetical protein
MGGVEEWVVKTFKILTRKNTVRETNKKEKLPFDARELVPTSFMILITGTDASCQFASQLSDSKSSACVVFGVYQIDGQF